MFTLLLPVFLWVTVAWGVPAPAAPADCDALRGSVERVRSERITGSLEVAEGEARRLLERPKLDGRTRRGLQIELARVLDRVGLHQNARPCWSLSRSCGWPRRRKPSTP
jgi:hypothetical protein